MTEPQNETTDDVKRRLLTDRMETARAEGYLAAINAHASRASAKAMAAAGFKTEAEQLNRGAVEQDKKSRAMYAAAAEFARLLDALPPEATTPDPDAPARV